MTVQELMDILFDLIEQGRSTAPAFFDPLDGSPAIAIDVAVYEDGRIRLSPRLPIDNDGEGGDPIQEAIENATTFRPNV